MEQVKDSNEQPRTFRTFRADDYEAVAIMENDTDGDTGEDITVLTLHYNRTKGGTSKIRMTYVGDDQEDKATAALGDMTPETVAYIYRTAIAPSYVDA